MFSAMRIKSFFRDQSMRSLLGVLHALIILIRRVILLDGLVISIGPRNTAPSLICVSNSNDLRPRTTRRCVELKEFFFLPSRHSTFLCFLYFLLWCYK